MKEGTALPDVPKSAEGRVLATAQQQPGKALQTTIDPNLQETTVDALGGQSGGIAVLDARNGKVLALAGSAYSSPQPPGSTFKVITTTAGLEKDKVKLSDTFPVVTEINPDPVTGARVIDNAHDEACGGTFVQAFAKSCNTVFAPLGVKVARRSWWTPPSATATTRRHPLQRPGDRGDAARQDDHADREELNAEPTQTDLGDGDRAGPGAGDPAGNGLRRPDRRHRRQAQPHPDRQRARAAERGEPVEVTSTENARVLTGLMRAVVTQGTGMAAALPDIRWRARPGPRSSARSRAAAARAPRCAARADHRRLVHRLRPGPQAEARDRGDADRRFGRRRHDGGADREDILGSAL